MKPNAREIAIFGMLGSLMYVSKLVMEFLPNIHLLGTLTIAFTIVYRRKALYPIFIFIMIMGLFAGFSFWWVPHIYLWPILWGITMLIPQKLPTKLQPIIYMTVCALHGFLYGTMYAPMQALMFGLDFEGMIAWIVAGLPWDFTHGVSNFVCGMLIIPIAMLLRRVDRYRGVKKQ